jgi:hypothetical protein
LSELESGQEIKEIVKNLSGFIRPTEPYTTVVELNVVASRKVSFSLDTSSVLDLLRCLLDLTRTGYLGGFLYFALSEVVCKLIIALHQISRFNIYMQS